MQNSTTDPTPTLPNPARPAARPGSFCVPRMAVEALLKHEATACEVCAYLVLARFTDASGVYSTAGITAVNTYTGANKTRGGPVDRAIQRLKAIRTPMSSICPIRGNLCKPL